MGFKQLSYVAFAETDLELGGGRKATSLAAGVARMLARCTLTADERFKAVEIDTKAAEEVRQAIAWMPKNAVEIRD